MAPRQPAYRRARPAPRTAPGPPRMNIDDITWTRILDPRERYSVIYRDRDNALTERTIELLKIGTLAGHQYFGVMHVGKFKTLRSDRIVSVIEQLTTGHEPSIRPQPTYTTELPPFPLENAVYRMPTAAVSNRTWTVDLNRYICACPEKRIRAAAGYEPGRLGYVCSHMAKAILDYLPTDALAFTPEIRAFLADPRKIAINNLT